MKRLIPLVAMFAVAGLAVACAAPSFADEQPPQGVVMTLSAEGWVETKAARVVAVADIALGAENRSTVRDRVLGAFKKVSPEAEWRISRLDRSQDSAGLERWQATAEARLPESALGGLDARARSASAPGLQVRVQSVDFVPTLAEREATLGTLRADIYARAKAEAERLAKVWPDRGYRVARIDFLGGGPLPRPIPLAEAPARGGAGQVKAAEFATFNVAQKLVLRAQITLAPAK
ncbi:MAG TPA: hypothetical protein VFO61_00975 [Alphaproteobacteria bacterium]|nr:hypothetical protein [Alphaproteobacteria bacterium]